MQCLAAALVESYFVRPFPAKTFGRRELFFSAANFSKTKSGRLDRFRQKIVKIGAIFELFKFENFACHFLANLADPPRSWANLITIRPNPGTVEFTKKWHVHYW